MTEWNVEGIADEVIAEMKEEEANIEDVDYYVKQIAYWSVFSKSPDDADKVSEQVKEKVIEIYDC